MSEAKTLDRGFHQTMSGSSESSERSAVLGQHLGSKEWRDLAAAFYHAKAMKLAAKNLGQPKPTSKGQQSKKEEAERMKAQVAAAMSSKTAKLYSPGLTAIPSMGDFCSAQADAMEFVEKREKVSAPHMDMY